MSERFYVIYNTRNQKYHGKDGALGGFDNAEQYAQAFDARWDMMEAALPEYFRVVGPCAAGDRP